MKKGLRIGLIMLVCLAAFSSHTLGFVIGYGGTEDISYFVSGASNNNYLINNVKIWTELTFTDSFKFYLRLKLQTIALMNPTNGATNTTEIIPGIDQAFVSYRIKDLSLKFGRTDFTLGSGITMNGIADGLGAKYLLGTFGFQGFGGYTKLITTDGNPYNFSTKDLSKGANRIFAGGQVDFFGITGVKLYANILAEIDQGDEDPIKGYNSTYLSFGSSGKLGYHLDYMFELIYQTGTGPDTTEYTSYDISALAGVMKLQLLFYNKAQTGFNLDVAYATGSSIRDTYQPSGVTAGSVGTDKQFFSFGTYSTGFVFEPALSNLFYTSLSFFTMPFSKSTLTMKVSYYRRANEDGPVSEIDSLLELKSGEVELGYAADINYVWRIVSDISLTFGGGVFFPGAAFENKEMQTLFMGSLSLTF